MSGATSKLLKKICLVLCLTYKFPRFVVRRSLVRLRLTCCPLCAVAGGGEAPLLPLLRQAVDMRSPRSGKHINKRSGQPDIAQGAKRIALYRPSGFARAGGSLPFARERHLQIRTNFRASYTPALAKPPVRGSAFVYFSFLFIFSSIPSKFANSVISFRANLLFSFNSTFATALCNSLCISCNLSIGSKAQV